MSPLQNLPAHVTGGFQNVAIGGFRLGDDHLGMDGPLGHFFLIPLHFQEDGEEDQLKEERHGEQD